MSPAASAGHTIRVRGMALLVALPLLLLARDLHAASREGMRRLDYSETLTGNVANLERAKRHAFEVDRSASAAHEQTEAESVRYGSRAIEDVLSRQLAGSTDSVTSSASIEIDRRLEAIVESEIEALGDEREWLDPARAARAPRPFRSPPAPAPLPPVACCYELVNQGRVGYEGSRFTSNTASRATSDSRFVEYQISYVDRPAPRSDIQLVNALYVGSLRTSDTFQALLDHRFSRRWTGLLGGTLILDRHEPANAVDDSLLAHGHEAVVLHLPEGLDVSQRFAMERKIFERETEVGLSSFTQLTDFRVEKRVGPAIAWWAFRSSEYEFPSSRQDDLLRTDLTWGYAAPVIRKVDLDYTYTRQKETTNYLPSGTGDYVQGTNFLDILVRFSPYFHLTVDLELENRDYDNPDPTFLSYNRNRWNPKITVMQSPHLTYELGYSEETWLYREYNSPVGFQAWPADFRVSAWHGAVSYAKKRFTGSLSVDFGPTYFMHVITPFQSDFDTHDTTVSLQYRFNRDTTLFGSFSRRSLVYLYFPENDQTCDTFTTDLCYRF